MPELSEGSRKELSTEMGMQLGGVLHSATGREWLVKQMQRSSDSGTGWDGKGWDGLGRERLERDGAGTG